MRKLALAVGVALLFASWSASAAPVEWAVASGGNGHLYEVIPAPGIQWNDAYAGALLLGTGWDLASVTSQAEHDFIVSLLPASPFEREQY